MGSAHATIRSGWLVSDQLAVLVGISLHLVAKNLSLGATAQDGQTRRMGICRRDLVVPCPWSVPSCVDG